ncbi:MAG: translation initiation factor IF-2 [Candidatus Magasanikbacteria bacterium]|nr:translation initiation factor IF-2 [Candidatus Magasanikbacteria bacterium]
MNVTKLARQINTTPQELYDLLPQFGFDIGRRAIKVDERVASRIISAWPRLYRNWQEEQRKKREELKIKGQGTEGMGGAGREKRKIEIPSAITVRDFAAKLNLPVTTVIRELIKDGILASLNERIDFETASIIAGDFGFEAAAEEKKGEAAENSESLDRLRDILEGEKEENLKPRPPVVVVMGHVDHGKTRLLDAIRKTNVMEGEAGGITQHIGAYQVKVPFVTEVGEKIQRQITFIDTPGHEAFTVMRSRGAKVADVAILVVAVDDGVQPQTKEAIKIIEAAKLPYVVALNKIDKPEADLDRVKTQLSEIGLQPEEWGGQTVMVPISAKANLNIDKLLEMVLLVADMEKSRITANPKRRAVGTIIESHIDPQAGPVSTLLVQSGILRVGDNLAINFALYGRVKALKDWRGELIKEAWPSTPVQILGFKVAPAVGDILEAVGSVRGLEKKIKPVYLAQEKEIFSAGTQVSLATEETKEKKKHAIILRVDVLGSLEAIIGALQRMIHPEVEVEIAAKGLGTVTEAEVSRAEATGAQILGFHVPVAPAADLLARQKGVVIKQYKIIYDLLGDVKKELEKLLPPEITKEEIGKVDVLAIFRTEKKYQIVGGRVSEGTAENNVKVRIVRNGSLAGGGEVTELQAGKMKVTDVLAGQECGLQIQTKDKVEVGDKLELYREEIKVKKLGF